MMRIRLLAILLPAGALLGCERPRNEFVAPPPAEVTVASPIQQRVADTIEVTGTTRAETVVEVRARVRGFVESRHIEGGQPVRAGDLMYMIDPREYQAEVNQARADLESRRVALRLAEVELKRVAELMTRDAAASIEHDRVLATRDGAAAAVALAEAVLARAELDLEWTQVRAPVDGRLGIEMIDVGQLVGASEPTLMGIIQNDTLMYARFTLPEREVLRLRHEHANKRPGEQGRPRLNIRLGMANESGYPHWGVFHRADSGVDPATGTITVEALFDNADATILPGLFVRIQSLVGEREALLVPEIAVQSDQIGRFVLVVNAENVVERRAVTVGSVYDGLRRIDSGLAAGERVVINGLQRARPGATVKAVEGTFAHPGLTVAPGEAPATTSPASSVPSAGSAND
jgi:RND family efflux transporter MFP subunit